MLLHQLCQLLAQIQQEELRHWLLGGGPQDLLVPCQAESASSRSSPQRSHVVSSRL